MFKTILLLVFPIVAVATIDETNPPYPTTPNEEANVQNLGAGVNTTESEYTPFITPDEKFLFFESNRTPAVGPEGDFDLWYSVNVNAGKNEEPLFEQSANVGLPVNSENLDGHPTLRRLATGEFEMYFSSFSSKTRPGPKLTNIYRTVWTRGKWSNPENVAAINTDFHDRMPSISQDGKVLFFSSDRPGGKGADDIWMSEFNEETSSWGEPKNIGDVNTSASEVTPALHSDMTTLYFTSNRDGGVGGYDIYFTQSLSRLENPAASDMTAKGWAKVLNLGKPFNSEFDDEYPTVTANGFRVYLTSNRVSSRGAFDIFHARLPEFAKPIVRSYFKGKTLVAGSERPIAAHISMSAGALNEEGQTEATAESNFSLPLLSKRIYKLRATAEHFKTIEADIDMQSLGTGKDVEKTLYFTRNLKLPQRLELKVEFIDAQGKALRAKASGSVSSKGAPVRKIKRVEKIELLNLAAFEGKEDAALAALETVVVTVDAKKKGYAPLHQEIQMSEVLDKYTDTLPETLVVELALHTKGKTPPHKEIAPEKTPESPTRYLQFLGRVYFDSDNADKPHGNLQSLVQKTVRAWKKDPTQRVFVYGHTDGTSERAYNLTLSKKRALWVREELIKQGIPAKKITAQGAGYSQRRIKNDNTEAKRKKNRRVEIYITSKVQDK